MLLLTFGDHTHALSLVLIKHLERTFIYCLVDGLLSTIHYVDNDNKSRISVRFVHNTAPQPSPPASARPGVHCPVRTNRKIYHRRAVAVSQFLINKSLAIWSADGHVPRITLSYVFHSTNNNNCVFHSKNAVEAFRFVESDRINEPIDSTMQMIG